MRRNPRRNGSERAGSRRHETNVLSSINEYMGYVLSLSRYVYFGFFGLLGSEQTRTVPGKSPVSVLEPCSLILNFRFWCQYLFLIFLGGRGGRLEGATLSGLVGVAYHATVEACGVFYRRSRHGCLDKRVCVDKAVPVASDAWHGLVWVKVLAR